MTTEAHAGDEIGTTQIGDLRALELHVSNLKREADAATRTYDRNSWIRYAATFIPVPFVVLALRFHLDAWGYYVAGAVFLAILVGMYAMDEVAVKKRNKAIEAAHRAQRAYEEATRVAEAR